MDRAKDLLEKDWRSLTGAFESATLVEFVPVIGIKSWRVAPCSPFHPHALR
jgi:hypothetical protein